MYTLKQVGDILSNRCSEAFQPGVVGSDLIDKISEITISPDVKGDIRYSLELLRMLAIWQSLTHRRSLAHIQ